MLSSISRSHLLFLQVQQQTSKSEKILLSHNTIFSDNRNITELWEKSDTSITYQNMTNYKLSRRKVLLLFAGSSALAVSPVYAQKKKRPRNRKSYRDKDYEVDDNSSPSPTPAPTPAQSETYSPPHPALIPAVGGGVFGIFGLVGACFWKFNQQKASKNLNAGSAAARDNTSNIPIDPIEQELNQLKSESGMNRMKSVRRSSVMAAEVSEWYVFRSGKAEGPYTKLQLWEVQKITARTKVRRGENEWQRAGEIPELAKYLTQK
jgi:GYF domain 2